VPTWPFPEIVRLTAMPGPGQWCKKHAGKRYYFGPLHDPAGALACWKMDWDAIVAGRDRPSRILRGEAGPVGVTVEKAVAAFADAAARRVNRGELSPRTLRDYRDCAKTINDELGHKPIAALVPVDFELLLDRRWGKLTPDQRRKRVTLTKTILRRGCRSLGVEPPGFGEEFRSPPMRLIRRQRRQSVAGKFYHRWEVRRLLNRCDEQAGEPTPADWATTKACILLGINGALGQHEIATLRAECCDLDRGWIVQDRTKTEAERRIPLWPETIEAIRQARADRDDSPLLLTTREGGPLVHHNTDGVALRFKRVRNRALENPRGSFYWLRHTWITVAASAPVASGEHARRVIAGHVINDVHDGYVAEFPPEILRAVCEHVRGWLWPNTKASRRFDAEQKNAK
jgi:integrase